METALGRSRLPGIRTGINPVPTQGPAGGVGDPPEVRLRLAAPTSTGSRADQGSLATPGPRHLIELGGAGASLTDLVGTLIDKGLDVNAKTNHGVTALMLAAITGHTETVKVLLKAGADVDTRDWRGRTALMLASVGNPDLEGRTSPDTVKTLITSGADVNAKDNEGKTALMYATEQGYTEIVQLLKQAGAKE